MKLLRKRSICILLIGLLTGIAGLGIAYYRPQKPAQAQISPLAAATTDYPYTFVVFSDTHASSYSYLKKLMAKDVTALIRNRIVGLNPAFVVLTGDLVQRGTDKKDWEDFDSTDSVFRSRNIPLYPVLGNHDVVYQQVAESLDNYFDRFPQLDRRRWYSFDRGNSCFVVLDGNFSRLTDAEIAREREWLAGTLSKAEADPAISFIVVFNHEPAFTNSVSYVPNEHLRKEWLPLLDGASKVKFFFSGHVHYYERFKVGGINYVVNSTVGMPFLRQQGRAPGDWKLHDEYAPGKPHGQNFSSLTVFPDRIVFKTFHLDPGNYSWQEGDGLEVPR